MMDVRVSDSSFVRAQGPNDAGRAFTLASAGFPAVSAECAPALAAQVPQHRHLAATRRSAIARPLYKNTETRSLGATLFKIIGAHQIKFGGEFRIDPENRAGVSPTNSNTPLSLQRPHFLHRRAR